MLSSQGRVHRTIQVEGFAIDCTTIDSRAELYGGRFSIRKYWAPIGDLIHMENSPTTEFSSEEEALNWAALAGRDWIRVWQSPSGS